jgi:hypothetical protein
MLPSTLGIQFVCVSAESLNLSRSTLASPRGEIIPLLKASNEGVSLGHIIYLLE